MLITILLVPLLFPLNYGIPFGPPLCQPILNTSFGRFVTTSYPLEQLFLLRPWTTPLWFGLQFLHPPSRLGLMTIHSWIYENIVKYSPHNPQFTTWLFYSLWQIWKTRNDVCFNNKTSNPIETLHRTKSLCQEYLEISIPLSNTSSSN